MEAKEREEEVIAKEAEAKGLEGKEEDLLVR